MLFKIKHVDVEFIQTECIYEYSIWFLKGRFNTVLQLLRIGIEDFLFNYPNIELKALISQEDIYLGFFYHSTKTEDVLCNVSIWGGAS